MLELNICFDEMSEHQRAIADIIRRDPNVEAINSSVGAGGSNNTAMLVEYL